MLSCIFLVVPLLRLASGPLLHGELAGLAAGHDEVAAWSYWRSRACSYRLFLRVLRSMICCRSHLWASLPSRCGLQLFLTLFRVHGRANCVAHALPDDLLRNHLECLDLE